MTKDNAKDFLPLVQALAEGKTIQHYGECRHTWEDYDSPCFDDDVNTYRIKPDELWYVVQSQNGYEIKCSSEFETDPCREFESSDKSECEKWIEEHTPKYVPFESVDELIECWADKRKIPLLGVDGKAWNPLVMPLIWVKGKGTQAKHLITEYWSTSVCIGDDLMDLKELYDCYTFLDGSPIGKIKE